MKHPNLPIVIVLLIFSLLVSACQDLMPELEVPEPIDNQGVYPELIITATGEGWEAPQSASSGWLDITLNNRSDSIRQASFLRLAEGKTAEEVRAVLQSAKGALPEWLTQVGGPSGVIPGATGTVTAYLEPGEYVVLDLIPGADGIPAAAKGYFMPLTVEARESVALVPEADITLELVDYAFVFDYDAVTAGVHTIEVRNLGPQEAHEVAFIRLNDDVSVQDLLASLAPDAPPGPPPGVPIGGTAPFAIDGTNYITVEFEAGATYGLICFVPSTEQGGRPHFMLGMVGQFTVPR